MKLNQDLFTGEVDLDFMDFPANGYDIFADMKIAHGADTGSRILSRMSTVNPGLRLPIRYVTVSAGLGAKILREYVRAAQEYAMDVIAFTAHTKIPESEARQMYNGENMDDVIFNLGSQAANAGCHAIVLEAERLRNERVRGLPLKKLVTGIRIDPKDAGSQSRVTKLGDLAELKDCVDYVVVSSKYLENPDALRAYFAALL